MKSVESTQAVMFFSDNQVVKEMLYPEFEAVLDNVVGISDFSAQQIQAVYVRINGQLKITAAVFFLLSFDDKGQVDRSWNIPLAHLADTAGKGPDMGAGPILLACRSQCSVSWHQRTLWDPVLENGVNTFKLIAQSAKRNRLALEKVAARVSDTLSAVQSPPVLETVPTIKQTGQKGIRVKEAVSQRESSLRSDSPSVSHEALEAKIEALNAEHSLRIATMKSAAQDHIEQLQGHYRTEITSLKDSMASTKHLYSEEKNKNLALKETLDHQADSLKRMREKFQQQNWCKVSKLIRHSLMSLNSVLL